MKVEMEITFSTEEIIAMCLEKCSHIECPVEGKFEAKYRMYSGEVVCTFIPAGAVVIEEPPEPPAVPPAPSTWDEEPL